MQLFKGVSLSGNTIKLFSNFFNKKIKEDEMFNNQTLVASYLVGAFASAIVEASWDGIRDKEPPD